MNKRILYLGIILIPFIEVILFMSIRFSNISFLDTRLPKDVLSLDIALIYSLTVLFRRGFKPIKLKWALMLIGFMLISQNTAPKYILPLGQLAEVNLWFYKPFATVLVYFMLFCAVFSDNISIKTIVKLSFWSGLVMAIYVIFQKLGFEQWFSQPNLANIDLFNIVAPIREPKLAGTLGQYTIVGAYISMLIPLAISSKNLLGFAVMATAVILTHSIVSIAAMIIGVLAYIFASRGILGASMGICAAICVIFMAYNMPLVEQHSSGRVKVWKQAVQDIKESPVGKKTALYSFTGMGFGSFSNLFTKKHNSRFYQAHNEFIEILFQLGIVGAFLFVLSHIEILNKMSYGTDHSIGLLSSVMAAMFMSFGTFIYHLGVFQYYIIIFLALLMKENRTSLSLPCNDRNNLPSSPLSFPDIV